MPTKFSKSFKKQIELEIVRDPQQSNTEIGHKFGVHRETVRKVRKSIDYTNVTRKRISAKRLDDDLVYAIKKYIYYNPKESNPKVGAKFGIHEETIRKIRTPKLDVYKHIKYEPNMDVTDKEYDILIDLLSMNFVREIIFVEKMLDEVGIELLIKKLKREKKETN